MPSVDTPHLSNVTRNEKSNGTLKATKIKIPALPVDRLGERYSPSLGAAGFFDLSELRTPLIFFEENHCGIVPET
jgi:hypothetical protein